MASNRSFVALVVINVVVLLAVLAAEVTASDQSVAPLLRARSLELVDIGGKTRARINVESTGDVVFRLMDENGTIRVKIGASKSGSGLVLLNDTTEVGVHLLANDAGSSLRLRDKNGRQRLISP
jgi:hypothetical protein